MQAPHDIISQDQLVETLKAFKLLHGSQFHLISLGFFGSYARNEATPDSDVDIVFQTDKPDLFMTSVLRQELEVLLKRPVSVHRLRADMNPQLRDSIEREAKYV